MNGLGKYLNAAMALVACAACSSTSMHAGSQYAASAVIGPNGGTLTVTAAEDPTIQGTSITIPPGALTKSWTIQIGATNQSVVSSGALGKVVDFEPSGLVFAKPVSMSVPLNANPPSASRIAVMAVEGSGASLKIAPVTVTLAAGGSVSLATFQATGFTLFGAFDDGTDGGSDSDGGGCTPSCAGDATCGSSDGCGGTCDANCGDGGCTPTCGEGTCGGSDGCGGTCACSDGGCTPDCSGSTCGSSDGCGGTCNSACDGGCPPETDTFVVGAPKADVLFIVDVDDDAVQQDAINTAASDFFTAGASIDFRVAITTDNDYANDPDAEFGRLLPCATCSVGGAAPTIISPSTIPAGGTVADPATAFSQLLTLIPNGAYPTGTPVDEHFFTALYNALKIGPQPGVDFFRPGVFFAAITDNGDNESDASVLAAGNHGPNWYAAYFAEYFPKPYLFTWNYINPTATVTGTGLSDILQLPPAIQLMVTSTNGFAFNTGDAAWTTALGSIWASATTASTYYPLVGVPSGGATGMTVTVNGVTISEFGGGAANWSYEATLNALIFNTDPPGIGAEISVTYPVTCGGGGPGGCDVCDGGSCYSSCLEGSDPWCCGTSCVDEQSDANNCGGCGNVCSDPTTACVYGSCGCPDSETLCGEPDAGIPLSCIPSGTYCDAGSSMLSDGGCAPSCQSDSTCGTTDGCGGTCNANCPVDGGTICDSCADAGTSCCPSPTGAAPFCTDLQTDGNNCGTCGNACGGGLGIDLCSSGTCEYD